MGRLPARVFDLRIQQPDSITRILEFQAKKLSFAAHPSQQLVSLFSAKPFQGADPERASLVFLGLDANYSIGITSDPIFPSVLEYHADGPRFWRTHGVHHPFLLPAYRGAGRKYHVNFADIGLGVGQADRISFIELLSVPTVGRSSLGPQDFDPAHLNYLNQILFSSNAKSVFVSQTVINLMNRTGAFPMLRNINMDISPEPSLPVVFQTDRVTFYKHLHFSVYGKFEKQRLAQASEIRSIALQA